MFKLFFGLEYSHCFTLRSSTTNFTVDPPRLGRAAGVISLSVSPAVCLSCLCPAWLAIYTSNDGNVANQQLKARLVTRVGQF